MGIDITENWKSYDNQWGRIFRAKRFVKPIVRPIDIHRHKEEQPKYDMDDGLNMLIIDVSIFLVWHLLVFVIVYWKDEFQYACSWKYKDNFKKRNFWLEKFDCQIY